MRKSLVLVLPLALLAALSIAPGAGSTPLERASLHAASAVFLSDAAGDSGAAADVTDVQVGNDLVAGHLVFWVTVPNRPDDLVGDDVLFIYLDTDNNPSTGDGGAEFAIAVDAESVSSARWDGANYVNVDIASLSARFSKADKAIRVAVLPNDLGVAGAFNFGVETDSGDSYDLAPNGPPDWAYTLATGRVGLAVSAALVAPKTPVAGKTLAMALAIVRTDISEGLGQGKVTCALKAGTKSVRASRAAFVSGLALCQWKLPKSAKGKLLRASASVKFGGTTVKRSFSVRAR